MIAGQPSSAAAQNQSLSGWSARPCPNEALRKIAKTGSKFPSPIPHQGEERISAVASWKINQRKSRVSPTPSAPRSPKRSSVWPPKIKIDRQKHQQSRNTQRDRRRRAAAEREDGDPQRAAHHQNREPSPREIQHNRRYQQGQPREPKEPPLLVLAQIIVTARQDKQRSQAEQIGCLVAIGEGAEATLVMPEGQCLVSQVERHAQSRQQDRATREDAKLPSHRAVLELLGRDIIEPAQRGEETRERSRGDPRLRRQSGAQRNAKVVHQRLPPGRLEKPRRRGKRQQGAADQRQQHPVHNRPERDPRGPRENQEPGDGDHDSLRPLLRRAAEKAGEHRENGGSEIPPRHTGSSRPADGLSTALRVVTHAMKGTASLVWD